jgi:hypothetical protein
MTEPIMASQPAPHFCQDDHDPVCYWGDDERCPVCRMRDSERSKYDALVAAADKTGCANCEGDCVAQDAAIALRAALAAIREGVEK